MRKIAFVFPGQGAQYLGMGKELTEKYNVADEIFNEASIALNQDMKKLVFDSSDEELRLTENTQPAILTTSIAILEVLKAEGINPHAVAGLSLGEYSALVASGAMEFKDAVKVVRQRGKFMQNEVPVGKGAMAAILSLDKQEVHKACENASHIGIVEPANYNCPGQIVIAGEKDAVKKATSLCKEYGAKKAILLPVSAPFHTTMLEGAGEKLNGILKSIEYNDFQIPVVANVDAKIIKKRDYVNDLLVKQVSSPVLWEDSINELIREGYNTFIEVGPGKSLGKFIKRVSKNVEILNVEDLKSLTKTIEKLQ
ncbi:ACP S-malonyltransferase [Clostridiaceae bacterium HSG29]|nr:ACP S-malonyltransferase [Clostridiaceae bacterium HSG29]